MTDDHKNLGQAAKLGLATTGELLDELEARIDVDITIGELPDSFCCCLAPLREHLRQYDKLTYRTVGMND